MLMMTALKTFGNVIAKLVDKALAKITTFSRTEAYLAFYYYKRAIFVFICMYTAMLEMGLTIWLSFVFRYGFAS